MKKFIFTLLSLSFFITVSAQKVLPELKNGTVMYCNVFAQGQELPLVFTIKSMTSPITLAWSVDGYGEGSFEITDKALASGTSIFMGQPAMGLTKLGDTETYGIISKAAFKSLTDTKSFTYNNTTFKPKIPSTPMKFGEKEADVIHVMNDQKVELWILNNPNFPFIVQTAGLPIDVVVHEIK